MGRPLSVTSGGALPDAYSMRAKVLSKVVSVKRPGGFPGILSKHAAVLSCYESVKHSALKTSGSGHQRHFLKQYPLIGLCWMHFGSRAQGLGRGEEKQTNGSPHPDRPATDQP